MMYQLRFAAVAAAGMLAVSASAEVPELTNLVPAATGYQLIAKLNPASFRNSGYTVDNSRRYSGRLTRVGYLLKLTGNDGKMQWAFAAMKPFTSTIALLAVPSPGADPFQTYVEDLEVHSNVPGVKNGNFPKGNIEIWGNNYSGNNALKIPGATAAFDFGDQVATTGNYGSLQIHNFAARQTVIAFNNFTAGADADLGIGNSPVGNADWTFRRNAKKYGKAELFIVGRIENLKINNFVSLDADRAKLICGTVPKKLVYAPKEEMVFSIEVKKDQKDEPTSDYFLKWTRSGDDGKTASGREKITEKPVLIKTSLDKPGFVRIYASVIDIYGREVLDKKKRSLFFDGGACVAPEKLTGLAEPADFDAFWTVQKAKLAKVPLKYQLVEQKSNNPAIKTYAVTIDCPGPRPVTGFLTVPANAADKSLPVTVSYQGYGVYIKKPQAGQKNRIEFNINAHGFELNKDAKYYQDYNKSIMSGNYSYAFDPKQNADPEKAYFNGMALRVMRSLEFVKQLPQWNGKDLLVTGGSQGGLQSIWAASLDKDVSECQPVVPWCCDLSGIKLGRNAASWRIPYVPALEYFDAANHAKRIKCPVFVTRAGLGDYVCPPSGVAVMYNNIKAPKKIRWVQGSQHGTWPKGAHEFIWEQK